MLSFILLLLLLAITVLIFLVLRKNQQKHAKETVDRTAPLPALGDNLVPDFAPPAGPTSAAPTSVARTPAAPTPAVPRPAAPSPVAPTPVTRTPAAPTPAAPIPDTQIPDAAIPDAPTAAESDLLKAMDNWQLQVKSLRASQQYDDALEICRSQFPKSQAIQQAAIILRQQIKISQEQNAPVELLLQRLYSLAALADVYSTGAPREVSAVTQILTVMQNIREKYQVLGHQELKLLNKSDVRLLEQAWGKPDAHRHAEEIYSV
jgi:hypothetical protein